MGPLYNISFTTKALVSKYDEKGKLVCQEAMGNAISMTALPYKTAMQYAKNDNFKMELYVFENQGGSKSKTSSARRGIGNGTKEVDYDAYAVGETTQGRELTSRKTPGKTAAQRAAETGDMAGAING
ncbi:hypothetical protein PXK56_17785 [Phaeobacter gallaeciensis]|uniref:hypothetical protein n=1 Tax=Phaeobacter gallaeciensis TaxID=60890 RepID=UPI002380C412|nr:hypothetical protein [Phaeobacter gallaeciensis]MDE4297040.1 hypothetical protein [Phaeobacter gallaeciensis]